MAYNLMTIPKEIRLRILELVAEDVTPSLRLRILKETDTYTARMSLTHTISGSGDSTRAVSVGNSIIFKGWRPLFQETDFYLACRLLRAEFYQTLGASQTLDLTAYAVLAGATTLYKPETLDICKILPAEYANHVKQVRFNFGNPQKDEDKILREALTKAFPTLSKLSIRTHLEPELSGSPNWQDLTAEEIADYTPPGATVESVHQGLVNYVESLNLRSDRNFSLDLSFTAVDVNLACEICGYEYNGIPSFEGTAREQAPGAYDVKLWIGEGYDDYATCCAAGHEVSERTVY